MKIIYMLFIMLFIVACSSKQVVRKEQIVTKPVSIKYENKDENKKVIATKKIPSHDQNITYDVNGNIVSEIISNKNEKTVKYIYSYYNTKQLKRKTKYINGIKNGEEKIYYKNGNIHLIEVYKNGKKNGLQKEYYKNGNIRCTSQMMNNRFYGFSKIYYRNKNTKGLLNYNRYGQIIYLKTFRIDGKILKDMRRGSGIENTYFASGKLRSKITYFKGGKVDEIKY